MKKFGKLRQWTDEKLGSTQKTVATEEFRDMEIEINSRQQGLEAVHQASSVWMKALGKQKKSDGQDTLKGTPLELLGIALFQHGEEFTPESAYGQTLTQFGIAQQKIARLQEAFQERVSGEILLDIERSLAAMRDYQAARKKLESRRLTYDSNLSKIQKVKKEDTKAEEELRAARVRYEELSNDVQQRMLAIRQGETNNMRDITSFIVAQAEYYHESSKVMIQLQEQLLQDVSETTATRTHSEIDVALPRFDASTARARSKQRSISMQIAGASKSVGMTVAGKPTNSHAVSPGLSSLSSVKEHSGISSRMRSNSKSSSAERLPGLTRRVSSMSSQDQEPQKTMKANFDFQAEAPNELSIQRGDLISVGEETSSGWWKGQIIDEEGHICSGRGLFPANYCTEVKLSSQSRETIEKPRVASRTSEYEELASSRQTPDTSFSSYGRRSPSSATPKKQTTTARPPPPPIPKKRAGLQ